MATVSPSRGRDSPNGMPLGVVITQEAWKSWWVTRGSDSILWFRRDTEDKGRAGSRGGGGSGGGDKHAVRVVRPCARVATIISRNAGDEM